LIFLIGVISIFYKAVKMDNSTRLDPLRVDHLVSQLNPAHFVASQKNSNPA